MGTVAGTTLQLMVGFSVGMALLLAAVFAASWRQLAMPVQSRVAGFVMLAGLALTQLAHLQFATDATMAFPSRRYVVVVFLQSLGFYWLLMGLLRPEGDWRRIEWLLPLAVLGLGFSIPLGWAVPLALLLGGAAALHLGLLVHRLRGVRRWFALELKVLAAFAAMAIMVAVSALLVPGGLDWHGYAWIYSALIALGFGLVGWLLLSVPDLLPKTREAVGVAYAQSTLNRIDRSEVVGRLRSLFEGEQIHRSEALSLSVVAEMLGISAHQLSELVNSEFGIGFSRYVRQYRVETARRMLVEEPRASVLSVGMASGFSSQSSFYVAFKEQLGEVPGEYRRRALAASNTPQ
ncbi:MAG: helix-turn-helix domain-containing protein [Luteimonas sp.]|nr:helix-turn-helix domain-containing protein [Luteimonas sp.]